MKGFLVLLFMTMVTCMAPSNGHATSSYLSSFNSRYGTSGTRLNSCSTCHDGSPPATNFYGDDFLNQLNLGRPTATALANMSRSIPTAMAPLTWLKFRPALFRAIPRISRRRARQR